MEAGTLAQRQPGQTAQEVADQFNASQVEGPMTHEAFQDQSNVLGRIGELASAGIQGIKNQYENVRSNLNRAAALGGIAVAGIGVANAGESLSPDLAIAQGPQATASTAMSPEVAACIEDGTAMPEIKHAIMAGRGKRDKQSVAVITHSERQAPECIGETTRKIKGKAQIAKWSSSHGKYWKTIGSGEMYRDFPDGSYSAFGQGQLNIMPGGHNGVPKGQLDTCLPGPRTRPVRAMIEREVTYKATGKTYRKFSPISIKVQGGAC